MAAPTRALGALVAVALWGGCSEHQFHTVSDFDGVGELTLTGRVCDVERNVWLEGASVYTHVIDDNDVLRDTIATETDEDGRWVLDRLATEHTYTIYVQHGSELLDLFDVTLPEHDVILEDPPCGGGSDVEIAVVTGDYDDFEEVLPKLGIGSYYLIHGLTGDTLLQFLSDTEHMATFDAILFAGGHIEEDVFYDTDGSDTAGDVAKVRANLAAYVDNGGAVFASDWSYDVVERIWPTRIDFLGDDLLPDAAQVGETASVPASITDTALANFVGAGSVTVDFDLDAWPVIDSTSEGVLVQMYGEVPYRVGMDAFTRTSPLLVSFESGAGQVVFSSWRSSVNADGDSLKVLQYVVENL